MIKIVKSVLFAALFSVLLFGKTAQAQTINAATCNSSDVQAALNKIAVDGTTVTIPAGNCTWSTPVTYNQTKSFTLQGAGAISGTGSMSSIGGTGSDLTVIQDNVNHSVADPPLLQISTLSGKSMRITGIAFTTSAANATQTFNGCVRIYGSSHSVRIDHNHFNKINSVDLVVAGWVEGVSDHNQHDAGFSDEFQTRVDHGGWNNDPVGNGDQSWADFSYFGSSQFFFLESNNYQFKTNICAFPGTHAFAFDDFFGGRLVFRNNAVGNCIALQTHPQAGDIRGGRAVEVYRNTFVYNPSPNGSDTTTYFSQLVMFETGTGLWWGNSITGFANFILADVVRTNNATYPQSPAPAGWGYCGTTLGPSPWDNNSDATGRACIDSIGRGKGDLLTGLFPNKKNSATGTITWPHQASEPVYAWMNIFKTFTNLSNFNYWNNTGPVAIVENQDYYLELPNQNKAATFNGTAGVGSGPVSARPATCTAGLGGNTPGVGYWATDVNGGTLFVCNPTNTWTTYYTPYTFPHPLTQGSGTGSNVAAPTNLAAVIQ
jgi:hypothetical protein